MKDETKAMKTLLFGLLATTRLRTGDAFDLPIVFIKEDGQNNGIHREGDAVTLSCQIPDDTIAITWYLNARILGTSPLAKVHSASELGYTPQNIGLTAAESWNISRNLMRNYDAKAHFDQLNRYRRSIRDVETQMSPSDLASIHSEMPNVELYKTKLIIPSMEASHEGRFSCVAKFDRNDRGIASEPLDIQLATMADISVIQQQVKISNTHSNVVLKAEPPFSIPVPVITWYKLTSSGSPVAVCDLPRYYCSDDSLFISDVNVDDQGHFTSRAKNELTMKELDYGTTIELKVKSKVIRDTYETVRHEISLNRQQPYALSGCGSQSKWTEVNSSSSRNDIFLIEPKSLPNDEVSIECQNRLYNNTIHYIIQPKYAPVFVGSNYKSLTVTDNSPLTLKCPEYTAYPMARVEWKHNGKEVMQEHRIEGNQLVLTNPRKYSRGYYQCFVDNSEGTLYGLIDLNVKMKTRKNFNKSPVPSSSSTSSSSRPKFREAKCFSSEIDDDSFEIEFWWKSKQISLRKFIYRIEYIDPQADSNPLYSPPVVRDEWQVNEKKRHKKVRVYKAGAYKISIRSRDARGFSDEEVTTVQCRQRPKSMTNLRTKAPCSDKIPEIVKLNAKYVQLDTGPQSIVLEWQAREHFRESRSPLTDEFEIQIRTGKKDKLSWTKQLTRRVDANNTSETNDRFTYPYSLHDFQFDSFSYRIRRIWTRPCYKRTESDWASSDTFSIEQLRSRTPALKATATQAGENAVLLSVTSNVGPFDALQICWTAVLMGHDSHDKNAIFRAPHCKVLDGNGAAMPLLIMVNNLTRQRLWQFTADDGKGHQVSLSYLLNDSARITSLPSSIAYVSIDAGGKVTTTQAPDVLCDDKIDSLSFMQGSVIGILVVFVCLCVAIIVILLRRRQRDAKRELADDTYPKHSRDDHMFETEKTKLTKNEYEPSTKPSSTGPGATNIETVERQFIFNVTKADASTVLETLSTSLSSDGYNSHSTLPFGENTT